MKCEICKKETKEVFTLDKGNKVCPSCLEKDIYKTRRKIIKKHKKKELD